MPETVRQRVSRASLPLMTKLSNLPRAMPFLVMMALLLGGLLIPGPVGFILISVAAAFVGWVLYLAWPRLTSTERIMRVAVLMLAVALAMTRLAPNG